MNGSGAIPQSGFALGRIPVLVRGATGKRWQLECQRCGGIFHSYRKQVCCSRTCWRALKCIYHKTCHSCGAQFTARSAHAKFCSRACDYRAHRGEASARRVQYQREHRTAWVGYKRKHKLALRKAWTNGTSQRRAHHASPEVVESELKAVGLLPGLGFTDVLHTREVSNYFPCDILARKNGALCFIEVTTQHTKVLHHHRWLLANYLGATFYVMHIKPDQTWWHLVELTKDAKSSSCTRVYRKHLDTRGDT